MIIINGTKCFTIEEVEAQIVDLSDEQKQMMRNDFNGIPNVVSTSIQKIVTPRQIRIALVMSGFSIATIEAAIDSLPEPNKSIAKITWEYSVEFQRNNPLLNSMAPMLGLTESQVDGLFALASTL
jgi:hypothetical protein